MTNKPFSFVLHSGPVIFLERKKGEKKERKKEREEIREMRGEMPEKKAVVERRHRISLVRERLPFSPPLPFPLLSPRNSEFRIFPPSPSVNLHFPLSSPHSAQYFFSNHRQCCTIRNMRIYIYIYMYTGETWPVYILYTRSLLFETLKGKWRREGRGRKRK